MSFPDFPCSPHGEHVCMTLREIAELDHEEFLESLSPKERKQLTKDAAALANVLKRAINTYAEEHEISYGAIVEAIMFVHAYIDMEIYDKEIPPEDCDA